MGWQSAELQVVLRGKEDLRTLVFVADYYWVDQNLQNQRIHKYIELLQDRLPNRLQNPYTKLTNHKIHKIYYKVLVQNPYKVTQFTKDHARTQVSCAR